MQVMRTAVLALAITLALGACTFDNEPTARELGATIYTEEQWAEANAINTAILRCMRRAGAARVEADDAMVGGAAWFEERPERIAVWSVALDTKKVTLDGQIDLRRSERAALTRCTAQASGG